MNFYNTPRLPRALLHQMEVIDRVSERGPGGQTRMVEKTVTVFNGVVMPLSNLDWKQLPEGSFSQNSQKVYTDDPVKAEVGQIIRDTYDGQRYTVKTALGHNTIHPMVRFIVEGVVKK